MFCEGVRHCPLVCLNHLNCVKMEAFQIYLQSGNQRNVGCVGDVSYVVFGQKFPGGKKEGSIRREVCAHLHAVIVKGQSSMWNWLFGLPERVLREQSLDIKENEEHALDFALQLSRLFRSRWVLNFRVRFSLSTSNVCLIKARISVALLYRDLYKHWCCSFVGAIAELQQARYTTPNRRTLRIRTFTQVRETCTLAPNIW
jgi:hypothetical protein